jgi:hypothetical protein
MTSLIYLDIVIKALPFAIYASAHEVTGGYCCALRPQTANQHKYRHSACFAVSSRVRVILPNLLSFQRERVGGREGIRTPGLLVANEALSQLSYSPTVSTS